jgi:chemotaxis protein MotB
MAHAAIPGSKKPEKPPNHERWVISYADLLTLLLATFVVLYASSVRDKHKSDVVAESFVRAFHGTPLPIVKAPGASSGVLPNQPAAIPKPVQSPASANSHISKRLAHELSAEVLSLQKLQMKLAAILQPLVVKHEVSIQSQPLTLTIQLDASVLFPSGEADLKPPAIVLLNQVAADLQQMPAPFTITVQGFTDNQPITTAQFPSNWSLSAERAVSVVELFEADKVDGNRMAAEGFGEFGPIASNTNDAGRAQNRRVLLVIHAPDPDLK